MSGLNAFGTKLSRGDGDPGGTGEVFTEIAGATSISGPAIERETVDVTAHDSVDGWMEYVGGLKDPGEVSLDVNYRPAEHDTFIADYDSDDPVNYELTFPDGTVWDFSALLTGFEPEAPHDDKLAASLTFQVSGKPAITPAA